MSTDPLLHAVLGPAGAAAVARAVAPGTPLAAATRARAAVAWAGLAVTRGYSGPCPGFPEVGLLVKGEDWEATVDAGPISGRGPASLAGLLVALAGGVGILPKGRVLARLGKNLDLLAKAAWVASNPVQRLRARAAGLTKAAGAAPKVAGIKKPKVETPGPAAAPLAPKVPEMAQAPQAPRSGAAAPPKPKAPKAPKPLSRSEVLVAWDVAHQACSVCGQPQAQDGILSGCACFASVLEKCEIRAIPSRGVVAVRFPADEMDALIAFVQGTNGHR